jgi:Arc/MetJ-type ribon-helix-helix transcriptional regulator
VRSLPEEKVNVAIRKSLYEKAKKFVEDTGSFSNVDELVEFLLEEALSAGEVSGGLSEEDEEKVKERLRSLGYI